MMQRRHLLLALAAATLVTAHQAAGAADDQEKKMPNADELLEDGHSAKKIAAALKRSLKFGGTVAEQLAGGVCMNKRSNKWCASQLCFLPQAQGPACETLNQDQCEAAEFCAATSSGLEFNEQGKLLLKTKCTAVKSRCEKNSRTMRPGSGWVQGPWMGIAV